MKLWHVLYAGLVAGAAPAAAVAQTIPPPPTPLARADITVTLGWFNADKGNSDRQSYNDWYNSSLYGGIGAGWFWTDNHKTEIDFGATTEGDIYTSSPAVFQNQQTFYTSRLTFSTRRVTVSQQYQGYRNAWFHPHVAAGVDVTWERYREERAPVILYEPNRPPRTIEPARTIGPEVDTHVRPFAAVGFKAYMTQRSFFRSDMRFTFKGGLDEVLWRAGFGFDF